MNLLHLGCFLLPWRKETCVSFDSVRCRIINYQELGSFHSIRGLALLDIEGAVTEQADTYSLSLCAGAGRK